VTHDRVADDAIRDQHAVGWEGCMDGLSGYVCAP
jgi:hypothetical protein